jgi:hypothetical protein
MIFTYQEAERLEEAQTRVPTDTALPTPKANSRGLSDSSSSFAQKVNPPSSITDYQYPILNRHGIHRRIRTKNEFSLALKIKYPRRPVIAPRHHPPLTHRHAIHPTCMPRQRH